MGVSFSRSVKFGVFRFNFSGSGIGVSAGIPGLRVGTGPRGAYISAGANGFRYRQSLGTSKRNRTETGGELPTHARPGRENDFVRRDNIIATVEHTSADVMILADATGDELVRSMNEQAKRRSLWPFVAGLVCVAFFVFRQEFSAASVSLNIFVLSLLTGTILWVRHRDQLRKLTVLFYEDDPAMVEQFAPLLVGASAATTISRIRSVLATSSYGDIKYTAGASQGLKLDKASVFIGQPTGIAANIDVPIIHCGRTTLAFYPDRIFVFQTGVVGAVAYDDIAVVAEQSLFVEKEGTPVDATVVDRTCQYVNKKGGPDKRFNNNREFPVCRYQELRLSSSKGLDIRILGSKSAGFDPFVVGLQRLRSGT